MTAEDLATLSAAHLGVLAEAWVDVDFEYAQVVQAAQEAAVLDDARPTGRPLSHTWTMPNRGTLYRRVRAFDGSASRFDRAGWSAVVEWRGINHTQGGAPTGAGVLRHESGRWLVFRTTGDISSRGFAREYTEAVVGDTAEEAIAAAGLRTWDRAVLGLPTGDEDLDARQPGWHSEAHRLAVVTPGDTRAA